MSVNSVSVVYFSPTNTTRKAVQAIAEGTGLTLKQEINATKPAVREASYSFASDELLKNLPEDEYTLICQLCGKLYAILQQKASQVGSVLTEYNWKMVLAADEAEFYALQKEMIEKAKGLGYDEIVAFGIQECERMFRARKIMNEELSK